MELGVRKSTNQTLPSNTLKTHGRQAVKMLHEMELVGNDIQFTFKEEILETSGVQKQLLRLNY